MPTVTRSLRGKQSLQIIHRLHRLFDVDGFPAIQPARTRLNRQTAKVATYADDIRNTARRILTARAPLRSSSSRPTAAARGGKPRRRARAPKNQRPTKLHHEQSQVARMADHAIEAAGDELVAFLDRHQTAEPATQHDYRRQPEHASHGE